jgi:inorganic pyrophosphatase
VTARAIGILYTKDNAGDDPKIIAVPIDDVDPRFSEIHHIDDLGHHMKEELLLLFQEIKILEHDKYEKIEVKGFGSIFEAQQEIITSTETYRKHLAEGNSSEKAE